MPSTLPAEITGLYRYPVKGLTPEPLQQVALKAGQTLPALPSMSIPKRPRADLEIPSAIMRRLGRNACGIHPEVVEAPPSESATPSLSR
jgi:hypothetical protein